MKKGSYQVTGLAEIVDGLRRRPDTYVNFTLLIILQERTFTHRERVPLLIFLFTEYQHLVRAVVNYRPDCSELSCTGEIFSILDTWEDAWVEAITCWNIPYMGYSRDLYNVSLLCR